MELIIPILMFAIPVLIAVMDNKKRKNTGKPQVFSEPLFPEAPLPSEEKMMGDNIQRQVRIKPAPAPAPRPRPTQKAAHKPVIQPKQKPAARIEIEEENSIEIDPKKLIIYSEILKPKFDE